MFGYDAVRTEVVIIKDPAADLLVPIWRVPSQITKAEILEAWASCSTEVLLGEGSAVILQLLDYGTGGTANVGTVAGSLGGTAVTWTAGTPKEFTIAEGTLDADDYLVLSYDEEGTIDPGYVSVSFTWRAGVAA